MRKIGFSKEEESAEKELKAKGQKYKIKDSKKRISTHVRIGRIWLDLLRREAKDDKKSISMLMDKIVGLYFKQGKSHEKSDII